MLYTGMDKDEHNWRVHEQKIRAADTAHERYYRDASTLFSSVLSFADTALKASAVLNGGAAIAMLAFIGALLTAQTARPLDYGPLSVVLTTFGAGVLCSTMAAGASYVAQWFYSSGHEERELVWEHPYIKITPKSKRFIVWGAVFHITAAVLVVASYCAFVGGGLTFRDFADVALAPPAAVSLP